MFRLFTIFSFRVEINFLQSSLVFLLLISKNKFLTLLLFFSIACDNVSDIQPENSSDGEIASFPPEYIPPMMPYDEVGILHNQTCDVIYQILKAEKLAGNLNDDSDVLTCARNSGIDYLDENLNLNWGGITTDEYNSMFNFITTNVFFNFLIQDTPRILCSDRRYQEVEEFLFQFGIGFQNIWIIVIVFFEMAPVLIHLEIAHH